MIDYTQQITEADLEKLPDSEIKRLYENILQMWRDPRTHQLVQRAIDEARERNR